MYKVNFLPKSFLLILGWTLMAVVCAETSYGDTLALFCTIPKGICDDRKGLRYFDGCNECTCGDSRYASCTYMYCSTDKGRKYVDDYCKQQVKEILAAARHYDVSKPFDIACEMPRDLCQRRAEFSYTDGCNRCQCTGSEEGGCAKKACPRFDDTVAKNVMCKTHIDQTLQEARKWDQRKALPLICKMPKDLCVRRPSFHYSDGCNGCTCGDNDLAVCTAKYCSTKRGKRYVKNYCIDVLQTAQTAAYNFDKEKEPTSEPESA